MAASSSDQLDGEAAMTADILDPASLYGQTILGSEATHEDPDPDGQKMVTCSRCSQKVAADACQKPGSSKGQKQNFKCNKCNTLYSRVNRLLKHGTEMAKDWTKISTEEKTKFMQDHCDTMGDDLASAMLEFTREVKSTVRATNLGEYLPVSVYETRGFSQTAIDNIKKKCPSRFDASLGEETYQYMVVGGGEINEDTTGTSRTHGPMLSKKPRVLMRLKSNASSAESKNSGDKGKSRKRLRTKSADSAASAASATSGTAKNSPKKNNKDKKEKKKRPRRPLPRSTTRMRRRRCCLCSHPSWHPTKRSCTKS
jgi:hypothetical protein